MRFSHRLFLLLILLLTGAPILAQEPSDVAKNVRMMVSVLSVTPAGLRYQGHQSYVSFHLHVLVPPYKRMPRHLCLLSACHHSHSTRGDDFRLQWFYFGNESPTFQMELTEQYPSKALLLIAEQNTECIIGSAFCLIIHNNDVRFAVNRMPYRVAV